jgi:hypothetical protein
MCPGNVGSSCVGAGGSAPYSPSIAVSNITFDNVEAGGIWYPAQPKYNTTVADGITVLTGLTPSMAPSVRALKQFDNGVNHWATVGQVNPSYSNFEGIFGLLPPWLGVSGNQPIFDCVNGTDHFLSLTIAVLGHC